MIKKLLQLIKRTATKPEGLTLDSLGPVSRYYGEDRGTPIDRYYIEQFLTTNRQLIKGTVLEIADSKYSKQFGEKVSTYEVLHVSNDNPAATIIGNLTKPLTLPSNVADCFICTQTFNFIYAITEAVKGAHQLLKPGGYLLATLAGPCQVSRYDMDRWGDYWRLTTLAAERLFGEVFGEANVEVGFFGNCLATVSFIRGIAVEELNQTALNTSDKDYQIIITVKAKKVV